MLKNCKNELKFLNNFLLSHKGKCISFLDHLRLISTKIFLLNIYVFQLPASLACMSRKSVPSAFDLNHAVGEKYMDTVASLMAKAEGGGRLTGIEKDVLYPGEFLYLI